MRVLTVRQPWAWAIIRAGKDVENRSRNIAGSYRGPVAIHAGRTPDVRAFGDDLIVDAMGDPANPTRAGDGLARGVVIGVVDLTDAHMSTRPGATCCGSRWAEDGDVWHLAVANPRPLETPIPARGRLGLWRPDPDLEHAIRDQLR